MCGFGVKWTRCTATCVALIGALLLARAAMATVGANAGEASEPSFYDRYWMLIWIGLGVMLYGFVASAFGILSFLVTKRLLDRRDAAKNVGQPREGE